MYRVAWRAELTGATGHGTGVFTYEEAKRLADSFNAQIASNVPIKHWAEPAPDEEPR